MNGLVNIPDQVSTESKIDFSVGPSILSVFAILGMIAVLFFLAKR